MKRSTAFRNGASPPAAEGVGLLLALLLGASISGACAQAPEGVGEQVVVVTDSLLTRSQDDLPTASDQREQPENRREASYVLHVGGASPLDPVVVKAYDFSALLSDQRVQSMTKRADSRALSRACW